jgi:predicted SAM-dependent methyltransferase
LTSRTNLKIHIGGNTSKDGWKILDIQDGPHVDFLSNCTDMSFIKDESVVEIYASHVFEHLGHRQELLPALSECHRILCADGKLLMSVPDLRKLAALFSVDGLSTDQLYEIMLMMFGGQLTPHDFHKTGLFEELIVKYLQTAGFRSIEKVDEFGLFNDSSSRRFGGILISLNIIAVK